jgi:hypothetical protein
MLAVVSIVLLDFWKKSVVEMYYQEIQNVVNSALGELEQQHQLGKLVNAPNSNKQFLLRWVTRMIKEQRFDHCVSQDLLSWQRMGRSQGNNMPLETIFRQISGYYSAFFSANEKEVTDAQIERFLDNMENLEWEVSTSEPLVGEGKVQLFTEGKNSLALCSKQCDDCFEQERMIKPMNLFVRGNHAQFIDVAWQAGLMVHKRTDYKSNVKYHGEYLIFPLNHGNQLAEIPMGFLS